MGAGAGNFQPPMGGNGKGGGVVQPQQPQQPQPPQNYTLPVGRKGGGQNAPLEQAQEVAQTQPGIGSKGSPEVMPRPTPAVMPRMPIYEPRPEPLTQMPQMPIYGGPSQQVPQVMPRPMPIDPRLQRRADRFRRMLDSGRMNPQQYDRRMRRLMRRQQQPVRPAVEPGRGGKGAGIGSLGSLFDRYRQG